MESTVYQFPSVPGQHGAAPSAASAAEPQETGLRVVYRKITVPVTAAGIRIKNAEFKLEKNITKVLGISAYADDDARVFTLTQQLQVNGNEILPEGFDTRLLFNYNSVPSEQRFFPVFNQPAGNGKVEINCIDTASDADFASNGGPYSINYMLKCLQKD